LAGLREAALADVAALEGLATDVVDAASTTTQASAGARSRRCECDVRMLVEQKRVPAACDLAEAAPGNVRARRGVHGRSARPRPRVALVEGASFGLDTTRVYAPSPGEGTSCGFVRISPGIEHADALSLLQRLLVRALRSL
jgi:hypothetical protein